MRQRGAKYEESADLTKLMEQILATEHEAVKDALNFTDEIKVLFTSRKPLHWGGKCTKMSDAVRFKTEIAYLIIIDKNEWLRINAAQKASLLIHELHHVKTGGDAGDKPQLRRHEDDFCELPAHDKFSQQVYTQIQEKLGILEKLPQQMTLETPAS